LTGLRKARIALVGLPGTGKTTVGHLLAEALGWAFFDCDAAFECQERASIITWVQAHGWAAFRECEGEILGRVLKREHVVVSTGGGVVENDKNRSVLAAATVVWLDAPLEVLRPRLGDAASRPLLADDPSARLAELAARRNPLYAEVAELRVDVADGDPADAANVIMRELAPDA